MDTDTATKLTDIEIPMFERMADRLLYDAIQRYKCGVAAEVRSSLPVELELRCVFELVAADMLHRSDTNNWSL